MTAAELRHATAADPPWRAQELLLVSEVMRLVGQSLAPEVVLREMLHLLSELLGLNRGRIALADGVDVADMTKRSAARSGADTSSIQIAYGLTRDEMSRGRYAAGEGITGAVLATGQAIIVQDIDAEPRFLARAVERSKLPQETVAFIAMPIDVNRRTVGVLGVHRIRRRHRLLDDDVAVLRILATLAGQVLQLRSLVDEKTRALENRNALLERALDSASARYGIVGRSAPLLRALGELERVSQSTANVLLLGESGTGKELFGRAVHLASLRRDAPFIKVNCAAIPDTLLESELFGHERGAFTGATAARAGWFEQADGGTIFLDEIGELPLPAQAKLLRTLQEGTITRLGGTRETKVDVRLVAATQRDLAADAQLGTFRRDLFYRLNVIPIRLPSLAERREDIRPLALHVLNRVNQANQRNVNLSPGAFEVPRLHAIVVPLATGATSKARRRPVRRRRTNRYRNRSRPINITATAITATAPQPRKRVLRRTVNSPITFVLPASSIIAAMMGTATTPLTTALQNSARIGSIGEKSRPVPTTPAITTIE